MYRAGRKAALELMENPKYHTPTFAYAVSGASSALDLYSSAFTLNHFFFFDSLCFSLAAHVLWSF